MRCSRDPHPIHIWLLFTTHCLSTAFSPSQSGKATLADNYEYVMHGIVYRIEDHEDGQQL